MAVNPGHGDFEDASQVWMPELIERVATFLPENEVACGLRLVDSLAASVSLKNTVSLKQPVPRHAIPALVAHMSAPGALRDMSLDQRHDLVCLAAASGDVVSLERMIAVAGVVPTPLEMGAATAAGELDACRWLLERGCLLDHPYLGDRTTLEIAAAAGNRAGCEWLLAHGAELDCSDLHAAGKGGHTELLEWLYQQLPPNTRNRDCFYLLMGIATGCDLATLQRWWRRLQEGSALDTGSKGYILASAAASPTPDWREKVDWLAAEGVPVTYDAGCYVAARPDGVTRMEWLVGAHGFQPDYRCLDSALRSDKGSAESVRWLLQRLPPSPAAFPPLDPSAAGGSVAKLQLLAGAGRLPNPVHSLQDSLRAGYREVSAWLLEEARRQGRDVQLSPELAAYASISGDVCTLAWLKELDCPFDTRSWDESRGAHGRQGAAAAGREAALEFLAEQGCPMPADGGPYVAAALNGDMHTLEVLRRLGVPFGPPDGRAFDEAIGRCAAPLPVLRWLVEAGFPVDWADAVKAAKRRPRGDRAEVRAWARAQWQAARAAAGELQPEGEEEEESEEETDEESDEEDWF